MSATLQHSPTTLGYFCAPPGHYWEWDCAGSPADEAALRHDAPPTVVLRLELNSLLPILAENGLPPFGSILLILGALAREWEPNETRRHLYNAAQRFIGETMTPFGVANAWGTVRRRLEEIHRLPLHLRSGGTARQTLLRTIFDSCPVRLAPALSREVVDEFLATPSLRVFQRPTPGLNGIARMLRDLTALEKVFGDLPPGTLEQRLRTGLEGTVAEMPELPLDLADAPPLPDVPGDLLEALEREGAEAAQVAGITRRLAAILHVPKPVAKRDDLPLGGVSDISNRGDPSRLLMTELAWDDLTFAVRLSQGEALYLRRESPPAEPPPQRVVLLDTGIFMWGKPRLFALGAALALLRQKGGESAGGAAFALVEDAFVAVALSTVAEVQDQLARLEPHPHPGAALAELMNAGTVLADAQTEVFLITHPAALEVVARQPAWQSLATRVPLHSLVVDREGTIVLSRHSLAGARLLSESRVDLNEIVRRPGGAKQASAALTDHAGSLPSFYRQDPWPLCLPTPPLAGQACLIAGEGYVGVTPSKTVCWWPLRSPVGYVLAPSAPSGRLWGALVCPDDAKQLYLIFFLPGQTSMDVLVVRQDGFLGARKYTLKLAGPPIGSVRIQSGALVVHSHLNRVEAFSLQDGRLLDSSTGHQSAPWFDGSRFQPGHGGRTSELPPMIEPASQPSTNSQRRRLISEIAAVGFAPGGGLRVRKKKGRVYDLSLREDDGSLVWSLEHGASGAALLPLSPMTLPDWPDLGLTHAVFPDGRRIIHDFRGFIHVAGPEGSGPGWLTFLLVKGHTTAWCQDGRCFGDHNFLQAPSMHYMRMSQPVWLQWVKPLSPAQAAQLAVHSSAT